jgi:hypothetical protein
MVVGYPAYLRLVQECNPASLFSMFIPLGADNDPRGMSPLLHERQSGKPLFIRKLKLASAILHGILRESKLDVLIDRRLDAGIIVYKPEDPRG